MIQAAVFQVRGFFAVRPVLRRFVIGALFIAAMLLYGRIFGVLLIDGS